MYASSQTELPVGLRMGFRITVTHINDNQQHDPQFGDHIEDIYT